MAPAVAGGAAGLVVADKALDLILKITEMVGAHNSHSQRLYRLKKDRLKETSRPFDKIDDAHIEYLNKAILLELEAHQIELEKALAKKKD